MDLTGTTTHTDVDHGAQRRTRRHAIATGLAGLGAVALGGRARGVHAQDATPAGDCPITSEEENKALVQRYWDEVWNRADDAALADIFAADEVHHWGVGGDTTGPEAFLQRIASFRAAFPDFRIEVEHLLAEGDMVLSRYTATGTHEGPWLGIAATGRHVEYTGMNLFRIACGKVAESWGEADHLNLLRQLGGLPDVALPEATPSG